MLVTVLLKYAAIRLSLFAIPFLVMVFVGWHPLLAGGLSLIFAALASYIFLRKQKEEVSKALTERAERRKREKAAAAATKERDENVEDAILDEQGSEQDARPKPDEHADSTATDVDGATATTEPGSSVDGATAVGSDGKTLPGDGTEVDQISTDTGARVDETSTDEVAETDETSTAALGDSDARDDEPDTDGRPKLG